MLAKHLTLYLILLLAAATTPTQGAGRSCSIVQWEDERCRDAISRVGRVYERVVSLLSNLRSKMCELFCFANVLAGRVRAAMTWSGSLLENKGAMYTGDILLLLLGAGLSV